MLQYAVFAVIAVGLGFLAFRFGKLLFRVDTLAENVKRRLLKLSRDCAAAGCTKTAAFIENLIIGDLSGIVAQIEPYLESMTASDQAFADEFSDVFNYVLAKKLSTPEGRAYIKARLDDAISNAPTYSEN
jgi:hypothetical protein